MERNRKRFLYKNLYKIISILSLTFILYTSCYSQEEYLSDIVCKVIDKDTGEPITEIVVMALKVKDQKVVASYQDKTNSQGLCLINRIEPGDYLIFPYPAKGYVSNLPDSTIYIAPGKVGGNAYYKEFSLEKGGGIAGKVTREDGTPVANAEITVIIEGGNSGSVTTNENGEYEIFGLTPTTNAVMFIEPPGYTVVKREGISIQKNQITREVNFVVQELNKIQGKITDTAGNPIKKAIVVISSQENIGSTETDINGDYKIAGLTAGTYELQAWAPCYKNEKRTVAIQEGQPLILNIQLQKDTTYECPPEWQGYNLDYLPYDTGWYLEQPYEGIFAEDLPIGAKFILTGTPPGCCPCPPCPDCPGGVWIPTVAPNAAVAAFIGKELGYVIYNCLTVMPPLNCRGWYHCTIIGLIAGIGAGVGDAIVTGAPCVGDLEGNSRGVTIWAPIKGYFGVGVTLLWGSSFYGEIAPNLGVGAGIAYIRCKTGKLKCKGPCHK